MGITMLKMDRAKAKWKVKLQQAFEGKRESSFLVAFVVSFLFGIFPFDLSDFNSNELPRSFVLSVS